MYAMAISVHAVEFLWLDFLHQHEDYIAADYRSYGCFRICTVGLLFFASVGHSFRFLSTCVSGSVAVEDNSCCQNSTPSCGHENALHVDPTEP